MSTARAQLAEALAPLLPAYSIIPDPRSIATLDDTLKGTVQIVRAKFSPLPAAPQASYLEQMHVWVITHLKEQPDAEDDLDALVLEVTDALQALSRAGWDDAQRLTHIENHHAYRITATYTTDKEQ
jgi:hypothetical protein